MHYFALVFGTTMSQLLSERFPWKPGTHSPAGSGPLWVTYKHKASTPLPQPAVASKALAAAVPSQPRKAGLQEYRYSTIEPSSILRIKKLPSICDRWRVAGWGRRAGGGGSGCDLRARDFVLRSRSRFPTAFSLPPPRRQLLAAFARRFEPGFRDATANVYPSNGNGYLFFASPEAAVEAAEALRRGETPWGCQGELRRRGLGTGGDGRQWWRTWAGLHHMPACWAASYTLEETSEARLG